MLLLYNIAIRFYYLIIYPASFFNKKAGLWLSGRTDCTFIRLTNSIWFHFASLGEFEQGRPVLEQLRKLYPGEKIVITFFSPSGYEIRKNTLLADAVYYLPLDTAKNAKHFFDAINPKIAVFTKYEYWYHFFKEAHSRDVLLYVISGIFRPNQIFFKWYGGLHREMLTFVSRFFVQDEQSKALLQQININNVDVSGDTRFDRVWENSQMPKKIQVVKEFKGNQKLFIAGSTWPQDEKLVAMFAAAYPEWKFIFAPHEIKEEHINNLISQLPPNSAVRYSQLTTHNTQHIQTLIIDNIGMLSSLYQYGDIAYIGGGFGVGIHNTLEAAAFSLPVIFGPEYSKFKEAKDLISLKAGFSITNENELKGIVDTLSTEPAFYNNASKKAGEYVREHTGATKIIVDYINSTLT